MQITLKQVLKLNSISCNTKYYYIISLNTYISHQSYNVIFYKKERKEENITCIQF